jgi:hypothetical protein
MIAIQRDALLNGNLKTVLWMMGEKQAISLINSQDDRIGNLFQIDAHGNQQN